MEIKIWHGEVENEYVVMINNDIYIMINPLSSQGTNQYIGDAKDLILYEDDKPVRFEDCPDDIQKAIAKTISVFYGEVKK